MKKNQALKALEAIRLIARESEDGLSSVVESIDRVIEWAEECDAFTAESAAVNTRGVNYPMPLVAEKFHEPIVVFSDGACRGNPGLEHGAQLLKRSLMSLSFKKVELNLIRQITRWNLWVPLRV